jgi:ArsR family transcriptional regulator
MYTCGMKHPIPDALLERIARRFAILSEPARLRILRRLLEDEASVGDLAAECGLSQANASKHLALLLAGGFVRRRAEGNSVIYQIDDPTLPDLCEVACDGYMARVAAEAKAIKTR